MATAFQAHGDRAPRGEAAYLRYRIGGTFAGEGDKGQEFPAHYRPMLARRIEDAYNQGAFRIGTELHTTARDIAIALLDKQPIMLALREQLRLDGDDLHKAVRMVAAAVPALADVAYGNLAGWI